MVSVLAFYFSSASSSWKLFTETLVCLSTCGLFSTLQGKGGGFGTEVSQDQSLEGPLPSAHSAPSPRSYLTPQEDVGFVMAGKGCVLGPGCYCVDALSRRLFPL